MTRYYEMDSDPAPPDLSDEDGVNNNDSLDLFRSTGTPNSLFEKEKELLAALTIEGSSSDQKSDGPRNDNKAENVDLRELNEKATPTLSYMDIARLIKHGAEQNLPGLGKDTIKALDSAWMRSSDAIKNINRALDLLGADCRIKHIDTMAAGAFGAFHSGALVDKNGKEIPNSQFASGGSHHFAAAQLILEDLEHLPQLMDSTKQQLEYMFKFGKPAELDKLLQPKGYTVHTRDRELWITDRNGKVVPNSRTRR